MTTTEVQILVALISFVLFSLVYYELWSLCCKFEPAMISTDSPDWIKKPNFLLFFVVAIFFLMNYKAHKKNS